MGGGWLEAFLFGIVFPSLVGEAVGAEGGGGPEVAGWLGGGGVGGEGGGHGGWWVGREVERVTHGQTHSLRLASLPVPRNAVN